MSPVPLCYEAVVNLSHVLLSWDVLVSRFVSFLFFVLFIHPPFCGAFVSFRGSSVSSHQCNNQSNKSGQKYQFHLQKRKRERERVRGALGPPHVPPPFGSSGSECLGLRQVVYSTLSGACAQLSAASVNKVDEGVETEPCGTRVS